MVEVTIKLMTKKEALELLSEKSLKMESMVDDFNQLVDGLEDIQTSIESLTFDIQELLDKEE